MEKEEEAEEEEEEQEEEQEQEKEAKRGGDTPIETELKCLTIYLCCSNAFSCETQNCDIWL
jgi:hypothetical protein